MQEMKPQQDTDSLNFLRIQYDNTEKRFVVYWSRGRDNAKFYAKSFQEALRIANNNFRNF